MRCITATLWLEKPRDADLFIYLCHHAASYGRQWGATRTMARTRHHALRKTAANFAIVITYIYTYTERFVGGVADAEMCCLLHEKMADSYRRRTTCGAAVYSLYGARLFYRPRKVYGTGNALCGIMLLISSLTRLASRR